LSSARISSASFAPYDNVTREEFVKLIIELTGIKSDGTNVEFSDVSKDSWYASYVDAAVSGGVVKGIGNGRFGVGFNASCNVRRFS
jgi:hypothetical protein